MNPVVFPYDQIDSSPNEENVEDTLYINTVKSSETTNAALRAESFRDLFDLICPTCFCGFVWADVLSLSPLGIGSITVQFLMSLVANYMKPDTSVFLHLFVSR